LRKITLVTGGLGYIGSHLIAELSSEHSIIIIDNLSNSCIETLDKIKKLISPREIFFYNCDLTDLDKVDSVFKKHKPNIVYHFASLKSVPESINDPELYYSNNVIGAKNLIDLAIKYNVTKFIFSSSASVYGAPQYLPIDESHPLNPLNPYGQNKVEIENYLQQKFNKNNSHIIVVLRYFNPVGSHPSYLIGENSKKSTNIMPILIDVAKGKRNIINIFGSDYDTEDGTCVRDYIHIMDLIDAHLKCLLIKNSGFFCINVGTGVGYSVLNLIKVFQSLIDVRINYKFTDRRNGDSPITFASNKLAREILNWKPKFSLKKMCIDTIKYNKLKLKSE